MSEPVSPHVRLRLESGKSQEGVARDLGVSERTIRRLEKKTEISQRWRVTLAAYYGVDVDDLAEVPVS